MGFRFRRSVRLMPGVRVNFGKRGISTSLGGRGATVNIGRKGPRATVGIPGSGLSYSTRLFSGGRSRRAGLAGAPPSSPSAGGWVVTGAHVGIAGFGGAFLAMVGLTFFLDGEKDTHWIPFLERPVSGLSGVASAPLALSLLALLGIAQMLPAGEVITFLTAGIFGLIAYVAVDSVGDLIGGGDETAAKVARAGIGGFLYLELLDASFSFDGVIGAFALSNNLFIIALGLGIGAMFVRSITIMLVDEGTLAEYRFLEHGALYAIIASSEKLSGIFAVLAESAQ